MGVFVLGVFIFDATEYFLITEEPLYCRIDRTIHEVYISFQISRRVFQGLLPRQSTHKQSVFSSILFRYYLDCFSSMCELITMARSNFLDGCKKYCGVKGSDGAKKRISLFKKHRHRLTIRTVKTQNFAPFGPKY